MGMAGERGVGAALVARLKACEGRYGVVKVFSEDEAKSRGYTGYLREILREFYGQEVELEVVPDLIVVFEDYSKVVDEYLLVGVELKYVKDRKTAREAYRALGQPLRYLVYGFDATVLWLVFEARELVNALGGVMRECREWLGLPMVLLSTSPPGDKGVEVYGFWGTSPMDYCDLMGWLGRLCADTRNPVLKKHGTEKELFIQRRRALKASLRIP